MSMTPKRDVAHIIAEVLQSRGLGLDEVLPLILPPWNGTGGTGGIGFDVYARNSYALEKDGLEVYANVLGPEGADWLWSVVIRRGPTHTQIVSQGKCRSLAEAKAQADAVLLSKGLVLL